MTKLKIILISLSVADLREERGGPNSFNLMQFFFWGGKFVE